MTSYAEDTYPALSTEPKKRRNSDHESWESIKEKKQRVEQLVSGLSRAEKESIGDKVSSTTTEIKGENNTDEEINVENTFVDVVTTETEKELKSPNSTTTSPLNNYTKFKIPTSMASLTTFQNEPSKILPRIITCQSNAQFTQRPYFPVPRDNGIMIRKKAPMKHDMVRVPRDNKTPFLIYTPPPLKAHKPTNSVVGHPKVLHPPTLEPAAGVRVLNPHSVARTEPERLSPQGNSELTLKTSSASLFKDSKYTTAFSSRSIKEDVLKWTPNDVYQYLASTECSPYAELFKEQEIDGSALLHLKDETMISRLLGVKMGPALKINAHINYLKER